MMKEIKIEDNYSDKLIIKSNSLIEARYKLNLQESRVILWLLSQITMQDDDFKRYYLDIKNFSAITSLTVDNQYNQLKKITKSLTKKSLEIYESDKKTLLQTTWLSAAFYEFTKGYVALEFSPYLKPYLLKIKSNFTSIKTSELLSLKSIHSIRLFELLKQYEKIGKRIISLDELRSYCGVKSNQYRNYNAVKLYIIEKAKSEINAKTNYEVSYKEIKESRRVAAIEWRIKKKNLEEEKHKKKLQALEDEANSESMLIRDIMEYGFAKASAKKFVDEAGESVVRNALLVLSANMKKNQVKNPKGMLRVAIKEKWQPKEYRGKRDEKKASSSILKEFANEHKEISVYEEIFKMPTECMPRLKKF